MTYTSFGANQTALDCTTRPGLTVNVSNSWQPNNIPSIPPDAETTQWLLSFTTAATSNSSSAAIYSNSTSSSGAFGSGLPVRSSTSFGPTTSQTIPPSFSQTQQTQQTSTASSPPPPPPTSQSTPASTLSSSGGTRQGGAGAFIGRLVGWALWYLSAWLFTYFI